MQRSVVLQQWAKLHFKKSPWERVERECPVWHHQRLPGLTCPIQQEETGGAHPCLSSGFLFSPNTKKQKNKNQIRRESISSLCAPCWKRLLYIWTSRLVFSVPIWHPPPLLFCASLLSFDEAQSYYKFNNEIHSILEAPELKWICRGQLKINISHVGWMTWKRAITWH